MKYIVLDIETTGLNPWYGDQITCICAKAKDGRNTIQYKGMASDLTEKDLLNSFRSWFKIGGFKDYTLITKNGKHFDIPFILARLCMHYNLGSLHNFIDIKHIDLQETTKKRISLQDMATLLGCTPKSMTGLDAIKLWKDGHYEELQEYCWQDVLTTEECYLKLRDLGVIK